MGIKKIDTGVKKQVGVSDWTLTHSSFVLEFGAFGCVFVFCTWCFLLQPTVEEDEEEKEEEEKEEVQLK